jgi:hypothetical protein
MSQQQEKQISLQEYVGSLRNQIVLSYDNSKEVALRSFDDMTRKYIELLRANEEKKKSESSKTESSKTESKVEKK